MRVRTPAQARAWIRKVGIATVSSHIKGVPCLVEAITGERIKGSWWGHPEGKLIFRLGEALDEAAGVASLKLLDGKATLIDSALWPALLAVVLDPHWRAARAKTLTPAARTLWSKVEAAQARTGPPAALKALEESLLVHCASEHTDKGRHEKRLTAWVRWAKARGVKPMVGGADAGLKSLSTRSRSRPTDVPRRGLPHG